MGTAYYVALLAQYYFATVADCYVPVISADEFPTLAQVASRFSHAGRVTIRGDL
jgi:glucosamine 6-phosphate synthetase-like amidotransferase/phosphosugar isomerase protein